MKDYQVVKAFHIDIINTYFLGKPCETLIKNFCDLNWDKLLEGYSDNHQFTVVEIKALMEKSEDRLKELISSHGAYELLFWSRRLAPWNIFNVADETVGLYRDIMTIAIYKYGRQNDPVLYNGVLVPSSLCPYVESNGDRSVEIEKVPTWPVVSYQLDKTIEIECVSYIYVRLTQLYRWAGKGARIVREGKSLVADASDELEFTVNLYDRRIKKANLLANVGDWFQNKNSSSKNCLPVPYLNTEGIPRVEDKYIDSENPKKVNTLVLQRPNYLFSSLNLIKYGDHIEKFTREIETDYGFSAKEFILFLRALRLVIMLPAHGSLHQLRDFHNCAYVLHKVEGENYLSELTDILWVDEIQKMIPRDRLECVMKFCISSSATGNPNLDLWTRMPKKLIYQISPNWWVFDISHLIYPIHDILQKVARRTGSTATVRSNIFEESVVMVLEKLYGRSSLWVCRQRIRGTEGEKEIDASVVIKNTLFILEAKAMTSSPDLDCGNPDALNKRRKTLSKYLKQVDSKAKYIEEYRDCLHRPSDEGGAPIEFPKGIRRICPVLVTAFPEYIWNMNDNKFLDSKKEVPRLLTIDELSVLAGLKGSELDACPFVIKL